MLHEFGCDQVEQHVGRFVRDEQFLQKQSANPDERYASESCVAEMFAEFVLMIETGFG